MSIQLSYVPGATPLDLDEIAGLIPSDISTQGQLNQAEQQNILRGELWCFGKKQNNILNEAFVKRIHKKMFGDVWRWAGSFRKSNKSIGIDWHQIPIELHKLLDDTKYWIEHETYEWIELATRFHHRMVWIHPFPNGNGRFSRTFTDLLLVTYQQERFSWGSLTDSGNLEDQGPMRERYIAALKDGDQKKYKKLMGFVVS
ncbi:MAG: mobile mystery protein B [Pseudobdellovibrionaceae bacterium]